MKVVLTKDIKKLGFSGDVIEVASGYARNFLFPKRFATEANASALQQAKLQQSQRIKTQEEVAMKTDEVVNMLKGITLVFTKKITKTGHLYGSVSEKDIVAELKKIAKIDLEKNQVEMKEHIKDPGKREVTLHLPNGVVTSVAVEVKAEKSSDEK
jgi:large subunit ribosomal protein L9